MSKFNYRAPAELFPSRNRELYESPDYPLKKQAMNATIARAPASEA